jgi:hypothetical protein
MSKIVFDCPCGLEHSIDIDDIACPVEVEELEAENRRLRDSNDDLLDSLHRREQEIAKLRKQGVA